MEYISTRGNIAPVSAATAIKSGMVPGGGLFIPKNFPMFPATWQELQTMDYQALANLVFKLYLTDFAPQAVDQMVQETYNQQHFSHPKTAPLVALPDGLNILELWHGPTAAFKDMALQIMPRLLTYSVAACGADQETVILVATSGYTGKAALEGFKNVPGVRVIVFYPDGGVSPIQRLQMTTTDGNNTHVVAVKGNFDDCQSAVKEIFNSTAMAEILAKHHKGFSSANSINWGRLLPQVVYYFYAYGQMLAQGQIQAGDAINITVPTGNFGNILAAYYAKEMGLPVHKLICASNANHILTDVLNNGVYDCRRDFYKTTSPSMDILISSNFERFFYAMAQGDGGLVAELFQKLVTEHHFTTPPEIVKRWQQVMWGGYAQEEEVSATIRAAFDQYGYTLDPHTAVAVRVYQDYRQQTGDTTPNVIASTASPFKFGRAVLTALTGKTPVGEDEEALLAQLSLLTGQPVHPGLAGVSQKPVRHQKVVDTNQIDRAVLEILGIA